MVVSGVVASIDLVDLVGFRWLRLGSFLRDMHGWVGRGRARWLVCLSEVDRRARAQSAHV